MLGGDTYDNSTHTGGTKITNVADGSDPSDAVNFSQLTTTNNNVTNLGDQVNNIYATGTKYFHANSTGTDSSATGIDAVAIGMGAVADVARSVALGDGATTLAAVGTAGTKLLGVDYAFAGTAPVGTVSMGSAGSERTLTNLAAGRLSADSTDGVNGSQLFATNTALNTVTSSVTNLDAGTVKYDKYVDGTVNYNSITLGGDTYDNSTHTGGTKITNVADGSDPSDAVNFSQLTTTNNNVTNLGDQVNNIYATGTKYFHANSTGTDSSATGIDAVAIGMGAVADVARSVALGDGATTLAAVGTAGTTIRGNDYAFAGAAPVGTVSIGSKGAERTLTNVAAGRLSADSTDGVNGSQLFATNQAIDSLDISFTDLDNHAVKYDTHVDGTVNYNSVTMGGDTYNSTTHTGGTKITNVADGSAPSDAVNFSQLTETNNNINNVYSNGTKYFHANSSGADSAATGADAVAIGQSATASAMNAIAIGNGADASTASSVALGDGAKTQAAVGTSGITLQGKNYAFAGSAPVGTVSVGGAGAERTITNVAAGQVTATSTDAVNGSQLYAVADAVNNINSDITNIDQRSVKYDVNTDGTTNYNKITLGGGPTTITNVAAGTQDSDAVNYAQLEVVSTQVTNISNGTDGMFQVNNTSNLPKPKPTGKDSTAGGAGAVASGDNSVALGANSVASATNAVALGANSVADRANSVSVGSAGNERQVTNVAAGTSGTDAVNVNQLKSGVADANQYTDNKFGDLKNLVDGNKDKLSAGIAGAMAMASLPQPYAPGASMVSMGGGTYQNQSAVALGVSAISDNGKWVAKLSGTTNSQGDAGAAVGVGYQW
ncbi:YadA family autotransporter adhesin [Rahnella contaminans]|uniref:YadA family autotransporter adhesin n=1 Tax=Rahnella contaminans TaxID=2703882 RepID=UPI003C2DF5F0